MNQNSFKTLQEALLLSLEEKLTDDEEFAVLYEEFTPQNLPFRHWDYEKFCLENKDPAECKHRRTSRGGGGGGSPPSLENIRAKRQKFGQ